jgi:hypothetical protein
MKTMKAALHSVLCCEKKIAPVFRPSRRPLLATTLLFLLTMTPGARTQYPLTPQPPALTGSTLGTNLRNAVSAIENQASIVRRSANDWGRRANSASYDGTYFQQDLSTLQIQFQVLREQFNWLATLALQLGRPRANNSVAELAAGLNIIAELFTFLGSQFQAGTLDRQTIVRTCRAFEDALREWERELKKNSSRLGLVY